MTSSSKDPLAPFDPPFRDFLIRHELIHPDGPAWAVAVSGGGDSVLLLTLLIRHRPPDRPVDILYFNHHTDPARNTRDQEFVATLAARYGAKLIVGESRTPEKKRTDVSETLLRKERQEFFQAYLAQTPRSILFLGHQKDDRIETILANLFRGTGPRGLVGIREKNGKFYRPLLFLEREEIRQVLREAELPFMEDPTNLDPGPLRNRIRLELRPAIDRIFPGGTSHLDSLSTLMEQEASASPFHSPGLLLFREEPGYIAFSLRLYHSLPPSRQSEFTRSILKRQRQWILPLPPERNLLRTLSKPPSVPLRRFPLGDNWQLDIVSDHVILVYLYPDTQNFIFPMASHFRDVPRKDAPPLTVSLPRGGFLSVEGLGKPFWVAFPEGARSHPSFTALFSVEAVREIAEDLSVTYRRRELPLWLPPNPSGSGAEEISPRSAGPRTVNQLLSGSRIPDADKNRLPILTLRGKALWIPGWLDRTGSLPGAAKSPYLAITFQSRESSWWKKFLENP